MAALCAADHRRVTLLQSAHAGVKREGPDLKGHYRLGLAPWRRGLDGQLNNVRSHSSDAAAMSTIRLCDNIWMPSIHARSLQEPAHSRGSLFAELRNVRWKLCSSALRNFLTKFAMPSGSSTILFTLRNHTSPGLNVTFSSTTNDIPTRWPAQKSRRF